MVVVRWVWWWCGENFLNSEIEKRCPWCPWCHFTNDYNDLSRDTYLVTPKKASLPATLELGCSGNSAKG